MKLRIDTETPFGKYKLDARQRMGLNLTRKCQSRFWINLLRQIGGLRSCKIADIKVYGTPMRVYPGLNRSDKIMLGMPHIFDKAERGALAECLRSAASPSFIDIGANIGAYSIFVNSLGLSTKIIAIEADPEIFARLGFNSPAGITKLNIAVASAEGVLPFYINDNNRGENSLVESEGGRKIEVPAKRLLQVLDENNIEKPTAMKIDVEGAELDIFSKFYEEAPQTRWPEMVLMEHFHDKEALDLLLAKGYREVLRTKMNVVLKFI